MTPRLAMIVDLTWTMTNDRDGVASTPADALDGGLGALLNRVEKTFPEGEGVLLLTTSAALKMGAPVLESDDPQAKRFNPFLDGARSFGWKVSELRSWTTFSRPGSSEVHVGMLGWLDKEEFGLRGEMYLDTMNRLCRWHEVTGSAFHGGPAVAAAEFMRASARGLGGKVPTWVPKDRWAVPAWDGCERPYLVGDWSREEDGAAELGIDSNGFYLAAASTVELAAEALVYSDRRTFDPKRAGFWLVKIGPWNDRKLPDPAGLHPDHGKPRWVTTPTLRLLQELMHDGRHGGFEILESWTARGHRIFRAWAETMRDGVYKDHPVVDLDYDGPAALQATFKAAYKASHGIIKMGGPGDDRGSIRRPDWYYGWLAQARSNLWRRMDKAAKGKRFPLRIDVDRVWFSTDTSDYAEAIGKAIPGFDLGTGLGKCDTDPERGFRVLKEVLS